MTVAAAVGGGLVVVAGVAADLGWDHPGNIVGNKLPKQQSSDQPLACLEHTHETHKHPSERAFTTHVMAIQH